MSSELAQLTYITENYTAVTQRIQQAAQRANRDPATITLVAVTKTWPLETLLAAYQAGMRHFGENRAEELADKRVEMSDILGTTTSDINWHQIGTLQSRKTNLIAEHADVFHALDRLKIAKRLSRQLVENGRLLPTFLEVNISGEASKSGFVATAWESDATQRQKLRKDIETIAQLPGLDIQGLMTMAPWSAAEDVLRAVFRRTRLLAEWLNTAVPQANFDKLSMGMTDDFEIAIEEGATHVRVGRALFGTRSNGNQ